MSIDVTVHLNKKQYRKFRSIAKELNISNYKLLKTITDIFLENPKLFIPAIKQKLNAQSASKEQQCPH